MDYINKACFFASRLGLHDLPAQQLLANGNAAWSNVQVSEQLIPTARVCNRIKTTTAPSVAEVEHALDKMTALAVAPAVAVTGAPRAPWGRMLRPLQQTRGRLLTRGRVARSKRHLTRLLTARGWPHPLMALALLKS